MTYQMKLFITVTFFSTLFLVQFSSYSQNKISEIELSKYDQFEIDYANKIFKIISTEKNVAPVFYDVDLNRINYSETDFKTSFGSHTENDYAEYIDGENQKYIIYMPSDYYNVYPEKTKFSSYTPPVGKKNLRELIESHEVVVPLNDADLLVKSRQDKGKRLIKRDYAGLSKTTYPIDNKYPEKVIYRIGGVMDKIFGHIIEFNFVKGEILKHVELAPYTLKDNLCLNAKLYGHYEDEKLAGYYTIVIFTKSIPIESLDKLTAVFSRYGLDGELIAQKAYPVPFLYRRNYELPDYQSVWPLYIKVCDDEGVFATIDTFGEDLLFINDKMEVSHTHKWSEKPNEDKMPRQYYEVLERWYSYKNNSLIKPLNSCNKGPIMCDHSQFTYELHRIWGERYVYLTDGGLKKSYLIKI